MAGRAGRRGLDKIGTVVIMCRDEIPDERDLKHVIVGSPIRLESQFWLTYIMILHLLRVEELKDAQLFLGRFSFFMRSGPIGETWAAIKIVTTWYSKNCVRQRNMAAKGGRFNHCALGDIGNLVAGRGVAEGKTLPHVSKPDASLRAQLIAKAQEAAAAKNKKKCVPGTTGE